MPDDLTARLKERGTRQIIDLMSPGRGHETETLTDPLLLEAAAALKAQTEEIERLSEYAERREGVLARVARNAGIKVMETATEIVALRARLAAAEGALQFYGCEDNYLYDETCCPMRGNEGDILADNGRIARAHFAAYAAMKEKNDAG